MYSSRCTHPGVAVHSSLQAANFHRCFWKSRGQFSSVAVYRALGQALEQSAGWKNCSELTVYIVGGSSRPWWCEKGKMGVATCAVVWKHQCAVLGQEMLLFAIHRPWSPVPGALLAAAAVQQCHQEMLLGESCSWLLSVVCSVESVGMVLRMVEGTCLSEPLHRLNLWIGPAPPFLLCLFLGPSVAARKLLARV